MDISSSDDEICSKMTSKYKQRFDQTIIAETLYHYLVYNIL